MQFILIILTKTKRNDLLLQIIRIRWQNALNTVSNDLTQDSVPAEDGSNMLLRDQHFHAHSCPSGSALACPLMPIMG
jgi:hypothetical protein